MPRLVSLVLGYLLGALQCAEEYCAATAAVVSLLGRLAHLVDLSLVVWLAAHHVSSFAIPQLAGSLGCCFAVLFGTLQQLVAGLSVLVQMLG